jgi:hypothetical protein
MRVTSPEHTAAESASCLSTTTARSQLTTTFAVDTQRPIHRRSCAESARLRDGQAALRVLSVAVFGALLLVLTGADSSHAETAVVAQQVTSVSGVFTNIRNWLVGILAGLATVFLTIGGVRYLMAGSDPGEVEKAKQAFKSAGWGYGLAALAPVVVEILKGIVGV